MNAAVALILTALTILALAALATTVLVSLLPHRLRTAWSVLTVAGAFVAAISLGSRIPSTLPGRILATHAAAATLERVNESLPELAELSKADPMVRYELSSAFHDAYMGTAGTPRERARRAGHNMGLVIQRAHLRHLPEMSDVAASRLVAIERQILEEVTRSNPEQPGCFPMSTALDPAEQRSPTLRALQRAELRAKLAALVDRSLDRPAFEPAERAAFEQGLLVGQPVQVSSSSHTPDDCHAQLILYRLIEEQPEHVQGMWMRSQRMFPGPA